MTPNFKRHLYIFSFTALGFLIQGLAHFLIEIWYIRLLTRDFERFGLGLPWGVWHAIHNFLAFIFLLAGITGGYLAGKYWWQRLYDEKGCLKPWPRK